VHFSEAGNPVLGDPRYRPDQAVHARWPYKRLALHARLLGFAHPVTGREMRFESPLPVEIERFLSGAANEGTRPVQRSSRADGRRMSARAKKHKR
jgi:23S rRNA pseudouridine1911/1915/1917 synthase